MAKVINWLSGKKTHLLVLVYVVIQIIQNGGLEGLQNLGELDNVILAAALSALRAGVAKIGK